MAETPGKMYALASVLTVLAIVAVVLRFYSRRIKKVGVSWDDYLIVLALVGFFSVISASGRNTYELVLLTDLHCRHGDLHVRWYESPIRKILIFADLRCAGAANGSLGRHTQITSDNMPVFDHGVEVLFKVSPE